MPRVDFYVLEEVSADARLRLACRLAEQAFAEAQRVFVLAAGKDEARRMDDLLWTFRDRSFVPHELVENARPPLPPVVIGTQLPEIAAADGSSDANCDVLINLAPQFPAGCERFTRIIEPLDADPERRQRGRERYKAYRERGMPPESHTLAGSGNDGPGTDGQGNEL